LKNKKIIQQVFRKEL